LPSFPGSGWERIRVARWYVFRPKIPIWINFGGSCKGWCWYILWPFWYIFPRFGMLRQGKFGNLGEDQSDQIGRIRPVGDCLQTSGKIAKVVHIFGNFFHS
jgi:hypothetical protein